MTRNGEDSSIDRSVRGPNLLDMVPRRVVAWEEDDVGGVTLVRERPIVRDLRSLRRWVSFMLAPPRIRLDEVGSFAWLRMDGDTTVRGLVEIVRKEFGDSVEPVSQRLGHFVRLLRKERFVDYGRTGADATRRTGES